MTEEAPKAVPAAAAVGHTLARQIYGPYFLSPSGRVRTRRKSIAGAARQNTELSPPLSCVRVYFHLLEIVKLRK